MTAVLAAAAESRVTAYDCLIILFVYYSFRKTARTTINRSNNTLSRRTALQRTIERKATNIT